MYQPSAFRVDAIEAHVGLIRAHPLGLLISAGAAGVVANPIPFLVDAPQNGTPMRLRAHVARANDQWRDLAGLDECLVVFQGPSDYVTPSWYATKAETGKVVPTWNYAVVQVRGRPRVIEDAPWLRQQIEDLTRGMEEPRQRPWAVGDAPTPFIAAQIRGIVGIEISVARSEGKWKMSQNRVEADRAGVMEGYRRDGKDAMAALIRG